MSMISQLIQGMGEFAVPIVLALLEILFAIGLINGFWRLKRHQKRRKNEIKGEKLYQQAVYEGTSQIQFLIRCQDTGIVFVTDNIQEVIDIDKAHIQYNPAWLEYVFGRRTALRILRSYKAWDGTGIFRLEFYYEAHQKWLNLEIRRVMDGRYDLAIVTDITEYQEQSLALEEKIHETERESESKTTFLYRMSHEIRTPMNGIIGMLTLARKQTRQTPEVDGYLDKASELSQYLLSLINDILDMSRIEAGKIELSHDVIDLEGICSQLNDMFRKTVEAKGVSFVIAKEDLDVRYVVGDELRIMQVIVNFLSNSVKFTSEGEIKVVLRQMHRDGQTVNIMISVQDTGKGMEPEFISHMFRPFEQENADIQKQYGGTGLGMAITDQIVQLMGGEIMIDSLPGKGSNISVYFKLELPDEEMLAEQTRQEIPQAPEGDFEVSLEGRHILLVEDNEINAEIAISILEMEGIVMDHAENGRIAVETFESSPEGYYDVILMDVHMPVMNGLEAVQAIRALPREDAQEVLIIALSADAFVEDRRRAIEAGMNEHMAKPIDFEALKVMMRKFLAEKEEKRQAED